MSCSLSPSLALTPPLPPVRSRTSALDKGPETHGDTDDTTTTKIRAKGDKGKKSTKGVVKVEKEKKKKKGAVKGE